MEYFIGLVLSLVVISFGAIAGFERDRSFYPTLLIVVASYYVLFAAMGASRQTLLIEIAIASGFLVLAVLGFRSTRWLVAAAIAGHGIFDCFHHLFIHNPGMPSWWPGFCAAFDVMMGAVLALRLAKSSRFSRFADRVADNKV
jgi:hypothetical protein